MDATTDLDLLLRAWNARLTTGLAPPADPAADRRLRQVSRVAAAPRTSATRCAAPSPRALTLTCSSLARCSALNLVAAGCLRRSPSCAHVHACAVVLPRRRVGRVAVRTPRAPHPPPLDRPAARRPSLAFSPLPQRPRLDPTRPPCLARPPPVCSAGAVPPRTCSLRPVAQRGNPGASAGRTRPDLKRRSPLRGTPPFFIFPPHPVSSPSPWRSLPPALQS